MNDMPAFARGGSTNPGGKLTSRLDIPCTEKLADAIAALATLNGMPKAEYARWILERAMFGELPMAQRLAGNRAASPSDECRED